ncbi:MAG TPA: gephyrin-like molybdotransferase Glp [Polyangia bacterium]
MKPFFHVQTLAEVQARMADLAPLAAEAVPLAAAGGRTLAADVTAPRDLPGFARATMDGYAVRGRDTFGAGETAPGFVTLAGEVVMGQAPTLVLAPGQCARIGTGGMLPAGADAVIPVEHTRPMDERTVELTRAVAPGANVLGPRDEAAAGQVMLARGARLRPQDVGLLAVLGVARPQVVQRPRAAIVSTGDEVVPVGAEPAPGQVRDVNTYTLQTLVREAGGEPVVLGLVGDDPARLRAAVDEARAACDLTLLSGGSSVGQRDLTAEVFLGCPGAELLVHGVAVAPGKPFIWARAGARQLLGLPGQVASCLVAFHLFVEPMIERLLGREARSFTRFGTVAARLARNLPKAPGREEYVRVRLGRDFAGVVAEPVFGKSGLLATLIQGHGLVRVPLEREGLDQGETVTVLVFP